MMLACRSAIVQRRIPQVTACVTCHTDEETLKEVAEEPEAAESLSEGEG